MYQNKVYFTIFKGFTFVLFLYLALWALMVANGLKYDFAIRDLRQTSIIYLDNDVEAEVYLDEKLVANALPIRISEVQPEKYELRVQKQGFYDWNKEFEVDVDYVKRIKSIILAPRDEMEYSAEIPVMQFPKSKQVAESDDAYFGKKLLANGSRLFVLDSNAARLLQVLQLPGLIANYKVLETDDGKLLEISFVGKTERSLYYHNNQFELFTDQFKSDLHYHPNFGYIFVNDMNGITYFDGDSFKQLTAYLDEIRIIGFYGDFGNLLFWKDEKVYLADMQFDNVHPLIKQVNFEDVVVDGEKIYFQKESKYYVLDLIDILN